MVKDKLRKSNRLKSSKATIAVCFNFFECWTVRTFFVFVLRYTFKCPRTVLNDHFYILLN